MSEEAIYDEGYHDGIKDVVNVFLMMHMQGYVITRDPRTHSNYARMLEMN